MSLSSIISLIVALTSLIGAIWAIVKYYDKKHTQQASQKATIEELRVQELQQINKTMQQMNEQLQESKIENSQLQEQIQVISDNLTITLARIEENEIDRLRTDIIDCVGKIRNGYDITQVELDHVHHCYDKYTSKNGNSYIHGCMEFIAEFENECRRADIEFE